MRKPQQKPLAESVSPWTIRLDRVTAHPVALVFVVAVLLRLAAVWWLRSSPLDTGGDAVRYLSLAGDLLTGRPYGATSGDVTRVPLYPLFVAGHLAIFGRHLIAIVLTQAVFSSVSAVLVLKIVWELVPSSRSPVPGLLWAVYPSSILNVVVIYPQPLQIFWMLLATWLVLNKASKARALGIAVAGLCWGLGCLTRSEYLFFLPIFALLGAWRWPSRRIRMRLAAGALIVVAGFGSVVWWTGRDFPKTYRLEYLFLNGYERNAVRLMLRPVAPYETRLADWLTRHHPLSAAGGSGWAHVPFLSLFSPADATFTAVQLTPDYRKQMFVDIDSSLQQQSREAAIKLRLVFQAPDGTVQLRCRGFEGGFWTAFKRAPLATAVDAVFQLCLALKVLMYLGQYALYLGALLGLFWCFRRQPAWAAYLLAYFAFSLAGIIFASHYDASIPAVPRYGFTLMPFFMVLAGIWLVGRSTEPSQAANRTMPTEGVGSTI